MTGKGNNTILSMNNVTFSWDRKKDITLKNISFNVDEGDFLGIIGASGCGKSTLLNLCAGLQKEYKGKIEYKNSPLNAPSREIGIVFQEYGLFPWLTIKKNIEFGMNLTQINKKIQSKRSSIMLDKIQLSEHANKFPHELSGGMRQRVAIARSIIDNPDILLMDEPFGALDYSTRLNMNKLLLDIWNEYKNTIIFVTHDIVEAVLLSDKVILMDGNPGTIVKILKINLPRPRDMHSEKFISYVSIIQEHLTQTTKL